MNQTTLKTPLSGESMPSVSVVKANVRVFSQMLEIWHILEPDAFNVMIMKFNNAHPTLRDTPQIKNKIIRYINSHLKLRVCFKSKQAFTKHFTEQTYQAMKRRLNPNGNKSSH